MQKRENRIERVRSATPYLQELNMATWKAFMRETLPKKYIDEMLARHKDEDRPCRLMAELKNLREAGFKNTDVVWKHYHFAVYCGIK